jgi:hypothetical protein
MSSQSMYMTDARWSISYLFYVAMSLSFYLSLWPGSPENPEPGLQRNLQVFGELGQVFPRLLPFNVHVVLLKTFLSGFAPTLKFYTWQFFKCVLLHLPLRILRKFLLAIQFC